MSKKNRAARLSDFKQGVTVWDIQYGDEIVPRLVMGRPFRADHGAGWQPWAVDMTNWNIRYYSETAREYFGDAGVPDHTYDGRVPRFYLSRSAAVKALPRYRAYQELCELRRRLDHDHEWLDMDHDYGYGDEPPIEELWKQTLEEFDERGGSFKQPQDVEFRFRSDHKDMYIDVGQSRIYGSLINSKQIRLDFYRPIYANGNDTSECEPYHVKFIMRHNNVWYNMESDVHSWSGYEHLSPRERKQVKFDNPVPGPLQRALMDIVVINERKDELDAA